MVAPFPVRGGATVMAEPSRGQPMSGAFGRPPHWPSRMPFRFASLRRKRRPSRLALPWRSDSARCRRLPPPRCLRLATATSNQSTVISIAAGAGAASIIRLAPSTSPSQAITARKEPRYCRGRTIPAQTEAAATASPRPVEPEAQPDGGVLAVGRHVGEERRPHRKPETGGGDIHRPVGGSQPGRPAAAGRKQEGAEGPVG